MVIENVGVLIRNDVPWSSISVNGYQLNFNFNVPKGLPENLSRVDLYSKGEPNIYYTTQESGSNQFIVPNTPENYAKWVQPFVDLWQAEKDRIEQEQIEAEQEWAKFENRKERALTMLEEDYKSALAKGFVRTSMGFDADIDPSSIATLLGTQVGMTYAARTLNEGETVRTPFRDFHGLKRELDMVQLEHLIVEINGAQNHLRELKYEFKDEVKHGTSDNDSLNATLAECIYTTLDYSKVDESGNPSVIQFNQPKTIVDRIDFRWM